MNSRKITEVEELSSEEETSVCAISDFDSISDLQASDYECLKTLTDENHNTIITTKLKLILILIIHLF